MEAELKLYKYAQGIERKTNMNESRNVLASIDHTQNWDHSKQTMGLGIITPITWVPRGQQLDYFLKMLKCWANMSSLGQMEQTLEQQTAQMIIWKFICQNDNTKFKNSNWRSIQSITIGSSTEDTQDTVVKDKNTLLNI